MRILRSLWETQLRALERGGTALAFAATVAATVVVGAVTVLGGGLIETMAAAAIWVGFIVYIVAAAGVADWLSKRSGESGD